MINIGDNCTHCGRSTALGSGLFVNRIPSETESEDGWLCPECQLVECSTCEKLTLNYAINDGNIVCEDCEVINGN
jgi:hypothetical protein